MKALIKTCIAALALTVASAHAAPILTNGNFEDGLTGWTTTGNAGLAPYFPWFGGFYFGAGTFAQDGTLALGFNAGNQPSVGSVSQSFATDAGTHYVVSFDYGATNCANSCGQSVAVYVSDSAYAVTPFVANGASAGPLQAFTFQFIAQSNWTTLTFADIATNDSYNLDGVLDNVAVVPEPGSLALLGLGLTGLALRRRRA